MGNAGRNDGEYYTPRPLIRAMIAVVKPQIGDLIYSHYLSTSGASFSISVALSSRTSPRTKAMGLKGNVAPLLVFSIHLLLVFLA